MPMAVGKSGMSVEIVIYVRGSAAGETSRRNRRSVIHAPRALEIASRRKPVRACAKVKFAETAKERASTLNGAPSVSSTARKIFHRQISALCIVCLVQSHRSTEERTC